MAQCMFSLTEARNRVADRIIGRASRWETKYAVLPDQHTLQFAQDERKMQPIGTSKPRAVQLPSPIQGPCLVSSSPTSDRMSCCGAGRAATGADGCHAATAAYVPFGLLNESRPFLRDIHQASPQGGKGSQKPSLPV